MNDFTVWWAIAGVAFSAVVTRCALPLLGPRLRLSARIESALKFAPACALAAIIVPDLLFEHGALNLSALNPRLLAGIASVLIYLISRSTLTTILGGMIVFWLTRSYI